jgi:hypothetical protein
VKADLTLLARLREAFREFNRARRRKAPKAEKGP